MVKTKIAPSPIHGIGLFADQLIAKGTVIWQFTPGFDLEKTVDELKALPIHLQDWCKHFGYLDYHLDRYILCIDDARFVNHSDTPSMQQDYTLDPYGPDLAVREIQPGEELTDDYREFERAWQWEERF